MLPSRPAIFISAVSKGLGIARYLVAKTRSAVDHTPKQPDPTFGPVSYTQYEALYAHAKGSQVR